MMAAQCYLAGRSADFLGYAEAGQMVIESGRFEAGLVRVRSHARLRVRRAGSAGAVGRSVPQRHRTESRHSHVGAGALGCGTDIRRRP